MVKTLFAKQLWVSSSIIAASVVVAVIVLYFVGNDLAAQATAIATGRTAVENQTAAIANLANLESQAPRAAQYEAEMATVIPDQYGLVTFTQWFQEIGSQYGVTANASFQGSPSIPSGPTPGAQKFSFSVAGSPASVESFLDGVSTKASGFILSIASYDVTANGSEYNVNGNGTVFTR